VLNEVFATWHQTTPVNILQVPLVGQNGEDVSMVDVDSPETSETGRRSKKRKREFQDDDGEEHKRVTTEEHSPPTSAYDQTRKRRELYQALRIVLDVLVTPAQFELQKQDKADLEPIRVALRIHTDNAAAFLGRWLDASEDNISLSAALQIWRSRITTPGEDVLMIFSKHCLAPATVLLQQLKGDRDFIKGGSRKTPLEHQITVIEKLIAEHVLLPARRRYRNSSRKASNNDGSILVDVLMPLHGNELVFDGIADLFELAIRSTPMSTPRRRIAESPWLEAMFNALADCIGCDPHTKTKEKSDDKSIFSFSELVQLVSKHNVSLQRSTTKAILQNHAFVDEYNTDWSLLAQLVKIDSGLFVDDFDNLKAVFYDLGYIASDRDEVMIPILKALVAARSLQTFIKLWHDQLKYRFRSWSSRSSEDEDRSFSDTARTWEDANLVQALSQHLEIAMTTRSLTELVEGLIRELTTDKEPWLIAAHASMLNSILTALRDVDNVKLLLPRMREFLDLALAKLNSIDGLEHRAKARLWTLIATLHRLHTSAAIPVETAKLVMTFDSKLDTIISANLRRRQQIPSQSAQCTSPASLACLGSVCDDIRSRHIALTSFASLKILPSFLRSITSGLPVSVLIDLTDVLSCYPVLLLQGKYSIAQAALVSSTLSTWLRAMKAAGRLEEGMYLAKLVTHTDLSDSDIVKWNGILDEVDNINDSDPVSVPDHDSPQLGLLSRLSRMPLDQWSLEKMEMWTEWVGYKTLSVTDSVESWSVALSALLRFLRHPTTTSLSDNSINLANIALRLDKYIHESSAPAADSSALALLFYNVCRLVLDSRLQVVGDESNTMQTETEESRDNFIYHMNSHVATLALWKAMVTARSPDGATFSTDQAYIVTSLHKKIRELTGQTEFTAPADPDPREVAPMLDVLASLSDQEVVFRHKEMMETVLENQKLNTIDDISVKEMRYRLECRLKRAKNAAPRIEKTLALLAVVKSKQNARVVETAVLETLTAAASDARLEFVKALMPSSDKSFFDQERLQLLHVLVKASSSKQYRSVLPEELVVPLASSLQLSLPKLTTLTLFVSTAQSLRHLLESHSRHLPQSVIENVLLTISNICSPSSSPNIPPTPQTSRHIFTLTTILLQTLLTHHRRKLRGRFELVIVALQALLRCLFTSSGTSTFGRIQQPTWLPRNSSSVDGKGLDASHVAQFTRLLTGICDPTLSAVRSGSSKGGPGLTDETRKAKRYAGQYVQYVLMELCECQLKGRLVGGADGAREALTPGVWAMLEVIGKDGLSACMEGMAGGGRSVLRGWWEEWRTIGRGRW